jgi:Ser/Thr protein kinase RdoA (MazF antagonist)
MAFVGRGRCAWRSVGRVDLRAAFGLPADAVVTAGPRGALGRIWRVEVGPVRYALKETFGAPPSAAVVDAELTFARRAAAAGVTVPACHPDRAGNHLHRNADGRWLRLYEWLDLRPVDPVDPAALGDLLARLHRCAPPASAEPDGGPPDPWYDRAPAPRDWPDVPDTAWSARLADRLRTLPALAALTTPAEPAAMILCHRDLHPENVLTGPGGELVVVDLDQVGPAEPGRELARALFDWFCDGPADLDAMRRMYDAYVRAGGPGRITRPADFTMLVASRLNFLLRQVRIAIDPDAEPGQRDWADREIDEALRILPTPAQLTDVPARLG